MAFHQTGCATLHSLSSLFHSNLPPPQTPTRPSASLPSQRPPSFSQRNQLFPRCLHPLSPPISQTLYQPLTEPHYMFHCHQQNNFPWVGTFPRPRGFQDKSHLWPSSQGLLWTQEAQWGLGVFLLDEGKGCWAQHWDLQSDAESVFKTEQDSHGLGFVCWDV